MAKVNCWDFKGCGRQQGGEHTRDLGICPASTETKLNGVHGGRNSGRACWIVSGTYCDGNVQGTFAQKEENCVRCGFYKQVRSEEGEGFLLAGSLKKIMHT